MSLAEGFRETGIDISLISPPGGLRSEWRERCLGTASGPSTTGRSRFGTAVALTPYIARVRDATLLVFDPNILPVVVGLRPVLRRRRVRLVLDLHNVYSSNRGRRRLNLMCRGMDAVIAVSRFVAGQVPSSLACTVLPRPLDISDIRVCPSPKGEGAFLLAGRIDREKHLDLGIRAMAAAAVDRTLVMRGSSLLGDQAYVQEIMNLGRKLLGSQFVYEGKVPASDLFSGVSGLLFCNEHEPSGRVIAEAQVHGVPVICPDGGGAREYVEDGVSGLLFTPGDVSSFAGAIRLIANEAYLETLRAKTLAWAAVRYDRARIIDAYLSQL